LFDVMVGGASSVHDVDNEFAERTHGADRQSRRGAAQRPHIRPPLTRSEVIAIAGAIAGILFTFIPLALWWPSIPDIIPTHFGLNGQPDAYGSKATLFIFPAVSLAVTILLQTLCRFPWVFNYPVRITQQNATRQYTAGRTLLRWVNAIVWLFAGIQWEALQIARGAAHTFSPAFTAALIVLAVLTPITIITLVVVWTIRGR
jgi:uncharacterized membrane protein